MPPIALHSAITTPMMRAVSDEDDDRVVAVVTAEVKTPEAPGGSALCRLCIRCRRAPDPTWTRVITPSAATAAGNKARNPWSARRPAVIEQRSSLHFLP